MATTLVILPEESHEQRSLACYSPWSHKESDRTNDWVCMLCVCVCVCVYVCLFTNKTLLLLYFLGWEEVHTFMFSGAFLCVLKFIVIKWNLINIYWALMMSLVLSLQRTDFGANSISERMLFKHQFTILCPMPRYYFM